ncbi:uncharacterized protein CLUP02_16766 [Colletotrichum lupini]|uniref:Uncharacterized protein n=1 Tax=Colletotrichum lupini TaxID=145971 RepID=A0A9Q8TAF5_9PEZI|nr:uncharacterized protein CLUP02_16766 [Colletotrichum lupini]UQC91232.1 hypothetical protein CLUP02_16766 [Colletotrichum lupini]
MAYEVYQAGRAIQDMGFRMFTLARNAIHGQSRLQVTIPTLSPKAPSTRDLHVNHADDLREPNSCEIIHFNHY